MTAWTDHVKEWAKKNGTTYGCALSKPECSASYRGTKPKAERTMMGKEDKKIPLVKGLGPMITKKAKKMPTLGSIVMIKKKK